MLHHVFSLLCQSASIDQLSNALSAQNILEKIEARTATPVPITKPYAGLPFSHNSVTEWFNDGSSQVKTKQRLVMEVPSGERLPANDVDVVVEPGRHHRVVGQIPGIPYAGNGVYWTEISVQRGTTWDVVARLPLLVEVNVIVPTANTPELGISTTQ